MSRNLISRKYYYEIRQQHGVGHGKRPGVGPRRIHANVVAPEGTGGVVASPCSDAVRWVNAQRTEASGGLFI